MLDGLPPQPPPVLLFMVNVTVFAQSTSPFIALITIVFVQADNAYV